MPLALGKKFRVQSSQAECGIPCALGLDALSTGSAVFYAFLVHSPHHVEGFKNILLRSRLMSDSKDTSPQTHMTSQSPLTRDSISAAAVDTAGPHGL